VRHLTYYREYLTCDARKYRDNSLQDARLNADISRSCSEVRILNKIYEEIRSGSDEVTHTTLKSDQA
jgi:hypothetical protein